MPKSVLHTKPPTATTDARDAAKEKVKNDLRALRSDVQIAADANPAQAEVIVSSSGMKVKKGGGRGKQQNTATDGKEEGSVELTAEGIGPHEWRMSTDETNWTALPASRTSKTMVRKLTAGTKYFFQNRQLLTKGEESEWSQSVAIRVR